MSKLPNHRATSAANSDSSFLNHGARGPFDFPLPVRAMQGAVASGLPKAPRLNCHFNSFGSLGLRAGCSPFRNFTGSVSCTRSELFAAGFTFPAAAQLSERFFVAAVGLYHDVGRGIKH